MMALALEFLRHAEPPLPVSVTHAPATNRPDDGGDDPAEDGQGTAGAARNPNSLTTFGGSGSGGPGLFLVSETSTAVRDGLDLLANVLKLCPGMLCAYVEVARCYQGQGNYEEASRVLSQALAMQVSGWDGRCQLIMSRVGWGGRCQLVMSRVGWMGG